MLLAAPRGISFSLHTGMCSAPCTLVASPSNYCASVCTECNYDTFASPSMQRPMLLCGVVIPIYRSRTCPLRRAWSQVISSWTASKSLVLPQESGS